MPSADRPRPRNSGRHGIVVFAVGLGLAVGAPWAISARAQGDEVPPTARATLLTTGLGRAPVVASLAAGVAPAAAPRLTGRLAAAGTPVRITVPRLHVDSRVLPISGQSGTLVPPGDPLELGWWREGAIVGAEHGTTVLTGHTVHTGGGALDHLDRLLPGDRVSVRTERGRIVYEVRRTRVMSTDALSRHAGEIFALDGPGRLVLITCDDWNGSTYLSNAVVNAVPVKVLPAG